MKTLKMEHTKKFKKEQWETDVSTYIVSFLRSSFPSFFQQIFMECLLHAEHCEIYISEEEIGLGF